MKFYYYFAFHLWTICSLKQKDMSQTHIRKSSHIKTKKELEIFFYILEKIQFWLEKLNRELFHSFKKRKKKQHQIFFFSVENNYLFNGRFQYVRTPDILFVINKNHSPNYWKVVLHCVRYFFHVRDFLLTIPGRARPPGYPPAHASLVVKSYQNLIWKKKELH